jgi:hypothetical protein
VNHTDHTHTHTHTYLGNFSLQQNTSHPAHVTSSHRIEGRRNFEDRPQLVQEGEVIVDRLTDIPHLQAQNLTSQIWIVEVLLFHIIGWIRCQIVQQLLQRVWLQKTTEEADREREGEEEEEEGKNTMRTSRRGEKQAHA